MLNSMQIVVDLLGRFDMYGGLILKEFLISLTL